MATAFCWFGVAGRRRLVAQAGGQTLGFVLHLVLVALQWQERGKVTVKPWFDVPRMNE